MSLVAATSLIFLALLGALAGDVNPASQVGRTFDLFDWTGVNPTGAFAIFSPYAWDLSNLYTTGEVTLTAVPEPTSLTLLIFTAAGWPPRRGRGQMPTPVYSSLREMRH